MFMLVKYLTDAFRLLIVLAMVNLGFAADVQTANGQIAGKIFDTDGTANLKEGNVHVTNVLTGQTKSDKIDSGGCYSVTDLPVGSYSVSISYKGTDYML